MALGKKRSDSSFRKSRTFFALPRTSHNFQNGTAQRHQILEKEPRTLLSRGSKQFSVPAIQEYYEGKDQVQIDEGNRSCGMTLMLATQPMGYHTCPMDGFDFQKVAEIIQLPNDHIISFMIAVRKGTKEPWPKDGQLDLAEVMVKTNFKTGVT